MKRILPYLIIASLLAISALTGCGPKPVQKQSVLDSPDYHVSQGIKLIDKNEIGQAEIAFKRAQALDPDYAEAFSGLALVEAYRSNFRMARELSDEGVARDKNNPFTWAVRGRVKSLQQDGDNWAKKADRDFNKAYNIDEDEELVYYWWGMSKTFEYDYSEASRLFTKTIEMKGDYAESADREFAKIQGIIRSAPGSKIGNRIALVEKIDRADLAVLFLEELKLQEVMERYRSKQYDVSFAPPDSRNVMTGRKPSGEEDLPLDVIDHWAQTWIKQIIDLGIMESGPNGYFSPDQEITKAEFALFLQNIIIDVMHENSLATKYIGETSRFIDMRSSSATYNAAALCVDRGIIKANLDGTFGPTEYVSGADALLIIRSFQNYLSMSF